MPQGDERVQCPVRLPGLCGRGPAGWGIGDRGDLECRLPDQSGERCGGDLRDRGESHDDQSERRCADHGVGSHHAESNRWRMGASGGGCDNGQCGRRGV
ncbi:MAG: hypothetical protein ACK55Z_06255, partial [bacterium]